MHIELIDTLRCPTLHEDTWLVGAFDRLVDRNVIEGRLGCPVCGATYEISDGVVHFDAGTHAATDANESSDDRLAPGLHPDGDRGPRAGEAGEPGDHLPRSRADDEPLPTVGADDAIRLAAMLDLASPGGLVVLEGAWSAAGEMLASFIDARLLVMNPPAELAMPRTLSGIRSRHTIPVAAGSCRGIALHRSPRAGILSRAAVPALRAGGRLVAPAGTPEPPDIRSVARDERWWVAERASPPPALVSLSERRRPGG